jgi:hypothetical protein
MWPQSHTVQVQETVTPQHSSHLFIVKPPDDVLDQLASYTVSRAE